jgi:hypothetical protein
VRQTTPPASDGIEFAAHSNGGDWFVAWHPAPSPPAGRPHGAAGLCLTDNGCAVLIVDNDGRCDWPAGRPEGEESWEGTLRREMLEEACAVVRDAKLLGFSRGRCVSGHEKGLVLVRSIWAAHVDLLPWEQRFEIPDRKLVPIDGLREALNARNGFEPIYERAMMEAGL